MVGVALVNPSADVFSGQVLLGDGIDFQDIRSLLDIMSESIAQGYICAALSCLGIFFLGNLRTGELTPESYTKKEAPSEHMVQQDESTWLTEAFEVYFVSLLELTDKKELPSLVQALAFRLAILMASHIPAHLSSELNRGLLKKMVSAPDLSNAFVEGSWFTNNKNDNKRATILSPGSRPIESSKFAFKSMGSDKEISESLANASALVSVNEEGRNRRKKPDQWGLVAAMRDYDDEDDEDGDDSDEDVEGEDDNQGGDDNADNDNDDDDDDDDDDNDNDDDEDPGGDGEESDGGDEGEEDEESEEDNDDDEDDSEDEDDENEEDEEEPPKKKKK